MLYPMKLQAPLKDYLWGGTKLKEEYGKKSDLAKVAESWELSCHEAGKSIIRNGVAAGMTLSDWIEKEGKAVLGVNANCFSYFPLLIKLIDAHDNLSVQVHPDNEYALRVEGEYGKTEMWYIVDCEPGASLIYGFKDTITKEEFRRRIQDNTLLEVCNQVPVHKGDVFFIESGTLHAIGKGILICEIQQNSNTTYRVYDYDRRDKDGHTRELHVGKALDVTKCIPPQHPVKPLARLDVLAGAQGELLAACDYFTVYHFDLDGKLNLKAGMDSFQCLTVLDGQAELTTGLEKLSLSKGESVFLPAGLGDYQLQGNMSFILSKV